MRVPPARVVSARERAASAPGRCGRIPRSAPPVPVRPSPLRCGSRPLRESSWERAAEGGGRSPETGRSAVSVGGRRPERESVSELRPGEPAGWTGRGLGVRQKASPVRRTAPRRGAGVFRLPPADAGTAGGPGRVKRCVKISGKLQKSIEDLRRGRGDTPKRESPRGEGGGPCTPAPPQTTPHSPPIRPTGELVRAARPVLPTSRLSQPVKGGAP